MATSEPVLLRTPPAFRRDAMVQTWLVVKALSDAGDAVWTIAVAWTAVQIASPAVAGLIVAAGTVPRAVILLIGGAIADRVDARRMMLLFNSIRVVVLVVTAVWILTTEPTVAVLLIATVAFGICDAFYEPAAGTMPRQLVRPADLPSYSALSQTLSRLGTMAGAAIGGFLVAWGGMPGSAAADAITFTVVIAFIAIWLRPRFALPRNTQGESVLQGVASGFRHLGSDSASRTLVIALSGLNLAVGPALAIGLPLQATAHGWGAGAVGIFEALVGGGAMLGALAVIRWRPRHEAMGAFWALVVQGVGIVLVGIGSPIIVGIGCVLIGLTAGFASVLLGATFAATIAPDYLGRMSSLTRLGDDVLMPLAMALFGLLATVLPTWLPFTLYGGALVLLMSFPLRNPRLRAITLRVSSPAE
ncbi:MFS transporter [Microbacterium sp. H1-D42]|uniref:MFS transporter n=1 Tax=Microbacterium sp. H1-D42 TaxID=2925844 RepID=UPI001F535D91|nr:MFS transporter [Microbacterium sp. H1-D42]UNK69438.1 MFS transporter [Microbacterium sp. H1-D42]